MQTQQCKIQKKEIIFILTMYSFMHFLDSERRDININRTFTNGFIWITDMLVVNDLLQRL